MKMDGRAVQKPIEVVCINGLPYVGKDTQAELMVENDPTAVRISPGQILRDVVANRNGYRKFFAFEPKKLRADLKVGRLVDGDILAKGLAQIVAGEIAKGKSRIVFAGWPREEESFGIFQDFVSELRSQDTAVNVNFIYLRASEEEVLRRFEKELHAKKVRGREPREDDTPEGFAQRVAVFNLQTKPFLSRHAEEIGLLYVESGQTKHKTQEGVLRALSAHGDRIMEGYRLPPQARR